MRASQVQAPHHNDTSSTKCQDNHTKDGVVAAVNSVRLAKRVKESLRIPLEGMRYLFSISIFSFFYNFDPKIFVKK
jgi:hypothetical protein